MPESRNSIEFTVILYGVVASNALFRLSYDIDLRNVMLLFAFFILAADWVEYHLVVDDVQNTIDNKLIQFGIDLLTLVIWTLLTVIPPEDISVFTGIVALFVTIQWTWDLLLGTREKTGLILQAELELAVALGLLLVIHILFSLANPLLFAATVVLYMPWKVMTWKWLYIEVKQSERSPAI